MLRCSSADGRRSLVSSVVAFRRAHDHHIKLLKLDVPHRRRYFPAGPGSRQINNKCVGLPLADHVLNQPSLSRVPGKKSSTR